jgi:predicted TIM-barrel fold metal-dependent hydrolase
MSDRSRQAGSGPEYDGPLYDSHAHLVSDDPARYPHRPFRLDPPKDGLPAIRPPFGPGTVGIPGGMHGPNPINEKPTAEQMHKWMAEENVVGIAAVQKGMIYGTDNSYIVDAANLFPAEMSAVIIVDPQAPDTPQTMRDLSKRGVVSIRFFPVNVKDKVAWLSSAAALNVWTLADELGLVVDLEAPPYDAPLMIPVVEAMADRFPNLSIVLDHLFMPVVTDPDFGIGSQYDGFASRDNISLKWTSLIMDIIREQGVAPEAVLRRTVDFYGADKVMWGSDIGTSSGTYKEMVKRALDSTALLDERERRKVLHDTGLRIFVGSNEMAA